MFELARRERPFNMLRLLDHFRRDIDSFDSIFEDLAHFHGFPTVAGTGVKAPSFSPQLDIKETKDEFTGILELPGMTENDIKISLDNNMLTISGEKKSEKKEEGDDYIVNEISYGSFRREIPLGKLVDQENIKAQFKNGTLVLTLPKVKEEKKETKKIPIKAT